MRVLLLCEVGFGACQSRSPTDEGADTTGTDATLPPVDGIADTVGPDATPSPVDGVADAPETADGGDDVDGEADVILDTGAPDAPDGPTDTVETTLAAGLCALAGSGSTAGCADEPGTIDLSGDPPGPTSYGQGARVDNQGTATVTLEAVQLTEDIYSWEVLVPEGATLLVSASLPIGLVPGAWAHVMVHLAPGQPPGALAQDTLMVQLSAEGHEDLALSLPVLGEIGPCPESAANCAPTWESGCQEDLSTSLEHCGDCDSPCVADHGTASCEEGLCAVSCEPGYTGETCQTDIDECADQLCENGGVCNDGIDAFTCDCADGYTGETCQTDIDPCDPQPCLNGGVCTPVNLEEVTCSCVGTGFVGSHCDQALVDVPFDPQCSPLEGRCFSGRSCGLAEVPNDESRWATYAFDAFDYLEHVE